LTLETVVSSRAWRHAWQRGPLQRWNPRDGDDVTLFELATVEKKSVMFC
jgi:hypothetical protein